MTIAPGIEFPEAEIAAVCRRYGVKELSIFGSAARGELRPESDFDLLVGSSGAYSALGSVESPGGTAFTVLKLNALNLRIQTLAT